MVGMDGVSDHVEIGNGKAVEINPDAQDGLFDNAFSEGSGCHGNKLAAN
jgi:hypothetical protein